VRSQVRQIRRILSCLQTASAGATAVNNQGNESYGE
jgi:hypothetical protein